MKLFGKKTLALLLALSMVMSVCVFAGDNDVVAGETKQLADEALDGKTPTWSSNNEAVATVDQSGMVTTKKPGTAKITAHVDGDSAADPAVPAIDKEWTITVTEGTISSISASTDTVTVPYGTTEAQALAKLKSDVTVTADNGNAQFAVNATDWSIASWSDAVSDAGMTATVTYGGKNDTVTVKVVKASITSVTAPATVTVPVGTKADAVKLPTSVKVKLNGTTEKNLTVGTDLSAWASEAAYDEASTTAKVYTYTADLIGTAAKNYQKASGVSFTAKVETKTSWKLGDITVTAIVDGDEDVIDTNLDNEVYAAIKAVLGKAPGSFTFASFSDLDYGSVSKTSGNYTVDLNYEEEEELYEKGSLSDKFSYSVAVGGVTYTGDVYLTMYTTDVSATFTYAGGTLASIASRINSMLGGKMEAIEFEELDLEGGVLWADNKYDEEVYEDEYYTPSELADMVYLPNGSGETSELSYVAYTDYDDDEDEVDDDKPYIEGTIRLYSEEFLLLSANITSEEVVELEGSVFEEAFLDLNDDYEYLEHVTFTKPSSSDGYLYVEYDEDDNKHTSIGSNTKYYVEDDDKALIDDITYVPGKDTEGVVIIKFKAVGYNEKNKKVTVNGVMQITVAVAADITIQAGKEQEVKIDPDLFLEYIEEKDTSKKDLEIVSVTIYGAPYQAKKGYLVTDGDELTKSGDKTFYADEDDVDVKKKKYDLYDLSFLGGTADGTVEATFKVTYLREGSTTKRYADGTIDFVTGAAAATNVLNGSTMASQVFSFDNKSTLDAFAALGGNNNEYIVFTSLPVGGKLVYNWGTNNQQDVTVGTAYYVDGYGSQKQLKNVTFVPSYSASKVEKTVTMNIKAYNEKDKAVNGTINIVVKYASYSSKFFDITTSTYADSVDFLANEGITTGMTATTFGPNNNVTRAQFVTFLWRAAGSPSVYGVTNKFTDVKSTGEYAYAYQAILWAVQNGITTGRSATSFAPAANVTHQELLTFLYRYDVNYLKHSGATSSYVNYTDYSSVDSWAQTPVKWADYKGILSGYTIQPKVPGTRATVALWLHRMLTL